MRSMSTVLLERLGSADVLQPRPPISYQVGEGCGLHQIMNEAGRVIKNRIYHSVLCQGKVTWSRGPATPIRAGVKDAPASIEFPDAHRSYRGYRGA